jgi:hypothetical protein
VETALGELLERRVEDVVAPSSALFRWGCTTMRRC